MLYIVPYLIRFQFHLSISQIFKNSGLKTYSNLKNKGLYKHVYQSSKHLSHRCRKSSKTRRFTHVAVMINPPFHCTIVSQWNFTFYYNILNWSLSALSGTSAKISLSPQKYHFWHVCEVCDPLVHNHAQSSHHLSTAIPSSIFKGLYFLVCLRKQYMMPEIFYWLNFLRLLSQKGQKFIWVKVMSASYENIQAQGTWHYIPSEGVHMEQSNFVYCI